MGSLDVEIDISGQAATGTTTKRHSPSGISVLIVGAGPVGAYTALECWRKGHDVRVIERMPSSSTQGRLLLSFHSSTLPWDMLLTVFWNRRFFHRLTTHHPAPPDLLARHGGGEREGGRLPMGLIPQYQRGAHDGPGAVRLRPEGRGQKQ